MSWLRPLFAVVLGLITVTIVAEAIEFFLVAISSNLSIEDLTDNDAKYFEARNVWWILLLKVVYSFLAGLAGGHVTGRVSRSRGRKSIHLLAIVQFFSILWGGFFSEMSDTGSWWMWTYLLFVIPAGVYFGHHLLLRRSIN